MDVVLRMFLLKNIFKSFLLKKFALTMKIVLSIPCKDTTTGIYKKPIYSKKTSFFNKAIKNLKNKNNSRIFNNTTLNKIQSIFNYSALAIDLNSNFNESSTVFSFLINSNNPLKIIKGGGGGKTLMLIPSLEFESLKLEDI